jgi:hypothetical protein
MQIAASVVMLFLSILELDLVNHESCYIAMCTQFQGDSTLHLIVESNPVVLPQSRREKRLYEIPMIDLIEFAWRF